MNNPSTVAMDFEEECLKAELTGILSEEVSLNDFLCWAESNDKMTRSVFDACLNRVTIDARTGLGQKLYEIFEELYMRDYCEEEFETWEKHLAELGIDVFSWDDSQMMFKDMLEIIAEGKSILVDDPLAHYNHCECWVCLSVPRELANKIVILGHVPMVSHV